MADFNAPHGKPCAQDWEGLAHPGAQQAQLLLTEALAHLLADLLRASLSDSGPSAPAEPHYIALYRGLTRTLADRDWLENVGSTISRASLAKRCVAWLKLLLAGTPEVQPARPLRDFVNALGLFAAMFDRDSAARAKRARLAWLLTHERRLDAGTREAAAALIDACEHLGVLLWPDAETA
jgi:hypothetical protein